MAITCLFFSWDTYLYRLTVSVLEAANYFTTIDQYVPVKFKNFDFYITEGGEPTMGFISYIWGLILGPMKASLWADATVILFVGFAH